MPKLSLMPPREEKFRDLFLESAQNMVKIAQELKEMVNSWDDIEGRLNRITELEHNGDSVTHEAMSRLYRTFFTSFYR